MSVELAISGSLLGTWIAAVAAVVAIPLAILLFRAQRPRKTLAYRAYTEYPLISAGPMTSEIRVTVDGREVQLPHLLLIAARNTGNQPIAPEDFVEPLEATFIDAEIVATTYETTPGEIALRMNAQGGAITFSPFLLNPDESFVVTALLDGCPHQLNVRARIRGGRVNYQSEDSLLRTLTSALGGVRISVPFGAIQISLPRKEGNRRVPTHRRNAP